MMTGIRDFSGMRRVRDAGPMPAGGRCGERGVMKWTTSTLTRQLSVPVVALLSAAFAAGAVCGWIDYLHRSPVRRPFVAGSSAWWQQLAVALIAFAVFCYARW